MSKDKILTVTLILLAIVIIMIAFILAIVIYQNEKNDKTEKGDILYFVTNIGEKFGVVTIDGKEFIPTKYNRIARVNNTVYLKGENDSYLAMLDQDRTVSLGGSESNVLFGYDTAGNILPYFIIQYGKAEKEYVYKIYKDDCTLYSPKDYSTLNDAYTAINAVIKFVPSEFPKTLIGTYTLIKTVPHSTIKNKSQYIVYKNADVNNGGRDNAKMGVVDEDGTEIIPFEYSKIESGIEDSNYIKIYKPEGEYIFTREGKTIEVDKGFDAMVYEQGCIVQKRESIANKVYDLDGNVLADYIFNYPDNFKLINTVKSKSYMLIITNLGKYMLYNISDTTAEPIEFENITASYLSKITTKFRMSSFMYKKDGVTYALDFTNLQSYQVSNNTSIVAPLDNGVVYDKELGILSEVKTK